MQKGSLIKSVRLFIDWLSGHPAYFFLYFSLIFGIIICFQLQPLNGTDEFTHFPRAFQIESGQLREQKLAGGQYGGYLPTNIVNMVIDYRDLSRKPMGELYSVRSQQLRLIYSSEKTVGHKTQALAFTSDAPYPPWTYLPSVIGIFIAHLMKLPLIWYVYLARLSCLIVYVALACIAIKLIPKGKWFMVTLALLPTSITAALTIGLSALVLGTSWLMIALVFAVIANKVKLNWRMLAILTVLGFALSVLKQGYVLIAALPLIIPLRSFSNKINFIIWKVIFGILLLGCVITFGLFTEHISKGVVLTPILGVNIDTSQQIHYILHNPLVYTGRLLAQPFTKSFDTVYLGLVGIVTQRLIYLSVAMIGLLYLALLLTWKNTSSIPQFVKKRYYFIGSVGAIAIGTYLIIATALYIAFTQVGSSVVGGITGTYFLPLIPLALVLPMSIKVAGSYRLEKMTMLLVVFIILLGLFSTSLSLG
jgi:uncharacterized membrane protein